MLKLKLSAQNSVERYIIKNKVFLVFWCGVERPKLALSAEATEVYFSR